jgi:ABC-2 type transport system ATP-binding protein
MAMTATTNRALAVSTTGLTKQFGQRVVVDHLDLSIPVGSVCGFVGPNGAGKTTTIRMLLGLIEPTDGRGTILGGDLADPSSYLHKVGALIEAPAFYPQLSGRDNLLVLARLGRIDSSVISPVLDRVGLLARSGDLYRTYSLGMKQRLGLAAALLASPELLILDEPTNGLDPAGIVEMRDLIDSLALEGMTVFVSSHLLAEIEHICDHLVMISDGRTVFSGAVSGLRQRGGDELVLRTERPEQLSALVGVIDGLGFTVRVEDGDDGVASLVVTADATAAAALNRSCMNAGFALSHLAQRTRSLEEAFFELTGTHSRDVVGAPALGGIR